MDFNKNKYGIAALVIIAAAAIHYFFFYNPCVQPDDMTVAQTQLQCAMSMDVPALRAEICEKLHGEANCQLEEADRSAVNKFFLGKVNECAKNFLKSNNLCIDKYQDLNLEQ